VEYEKYAGHLLILLRLPQKVKLMICLVRLWRSTKTKSHLWHLMLASYTCMCWFCFATELLSL